VVALRRRTATVAATTVVAVGLAVLAARALVGSGDGTATPAAPGAEEPLPAGGAGTVVGSRHDEVPEGAIVVAPSGDDGDGDGTEGAPYRTVTHAVDQAPSGATIVLRAGTYHESVTIPAEKALTLQAWPGEEVWFDGSTVVTGWTADGDGVWRRDGWTVQFDASPSYRRGGPNVGLVLDEHPMAAYPDQVWVDGTALRQVGARDDVTEGAFFHDEEADRLFIGTNPHGAEVRASTLVRAIRVQGARSVLRGFGVRRYAPSVPDMGAVVVEGPGSVVEHVAVLDSATQGISVLTTDVTLRHVHAARAGLIGIHGNHADGLVLEAVLAEGNNVERFNQRWAAGGTKITRSRVVSVRDSVFRDNLGVGLWLDESMYDMTVVGNEVLRNTHHGVSLEISAKALFADNLVVGNGSSGLKINNVSDVRVWNNTLAGNRTSIWIVQDDRRHADGTLGIDPRYPDDPTMTWLVGPIELYNNVIADPAGEATCLLCTDGSAAATTFGLRAGGNVYHRRSTSQPLDVVEWKTSRTGTARFRDLRTFTAATGIEATSVLVTGEPVVTAEGEPTDAMPPATMARPLSAAVSEATGKEPGTRHLGAW